MSELEKLEQETRELNAKCDEAAAYVSKLEQRLALAGVGKVIAPISDKMYVGFEIYGKSRRWRIIISIDGKATPWSDFNRLAKLQTLPYVERLVQASYKTIVEQQKIATNALASIKEKL